MVKRPHVDARCCFVLMPFRAPFNEHYRTVLKPALKGVDLDCIRADEVHGPQVMGDIWDSIWKAKLVVADVTQKNPNVNYELGLCHALGVPTIIITQNKKHVPFDYLHHRYILYRPGRTGWKQKLKTEIVDPVKAVLDESSSRERTLVWPKGAKIVHSLPKPKNTTLPFRKSALLDFGSSEEIVGGLRLG